MFEPKHSSSLRCFADYSLQLCSFDCSQTVTLKSSPLTGKRRLSFIPSSRSLVGKKSLMTTSSPSKTRKFGVCAAPRAAENISTDLQNLLKSRLLSNYLLQNTKFIFACCFRSQLSKLSSYFCSIFIATIATNCFVHQSSVL